MTITIFNAISHFLVDAACVGALFSFGTEAEGFAAAVFVYNTLAFSTQCLFGFAMDRILRPGRRPDDRFLLQGSLQAGAMFVAAAAALSPLGLLVKAVLLGLGNSVFHVSAGSVMLDRSSGRAVPLGVFVAPGALGVTLGVLLPGSLDYVCLALGIASIVCFSIYRRAAAKYVFEDAEPEVKGPAVFAVVLLTAAVAVRAVGGTAAEFTWKTGALPAVLLTLCVFLGKFVGGFVRDRLGVVKPAIAGIAAAAVLTAFFALSMPLSLIGQLLINLSMPVTLWLMYRHIPQYPGLAFGLAASALWPGTLIGGLIKLTGPLQSILIIVCFLLGLGAIIYSEKALRK